MTHTMDLDLTPTPNSSQTRSSNDTDESNDTTPHTSHHHSLSFTKNHHHHMPPQNAVVVYKECMKNHAAPIGGHAVDGCGEFMSPPPANSATTSLKCAACGCHRSFHRRESSSPAGFAAITPPPFIDFRRLATVKRFSLSPSPPPPPLQEKLSSVPKFAPGKMMFTLSKVVQEEHHQAPMTPTAEHTTTYTTGHGGRKRFRSKFTQEQKDKMQKFAEKMGWKIQKSDEEKVRDFCNEIGVSRGVLKVWMHNNKNTIAKNSINTKDVTLMNSDGNNDDYHNGSKNNTGFVHHHHHLNNGKSEGGN